MPTSVNVCRGALVSTSTRSPTCTPVLRAVNALTAISSSRCGPRPSRSSYRPVQFTPRRATVRGDLAVFSDEPGSVDPYDADPSDIVHYGLADHVVRLGHLDVDAAVRAGVGVVERALQGRVEHQGAGNER